MKKEDKKLLLKDLCARLPYNCQVFYEYVDDLDGKTYGYSLTLNTWCIDELVANKAVIKPYLRPMSSMTNEEGKELEHILCEIDAPCWVDVEYGSVNFAGGNDFIDAEIAEVYIDWLNKKMFDYRGLIEKGLALEAKKGTYNIKEK